MHVKNTYPSIAKGSGNRRRMLAVLRWPFIFAGVAALVLNLILGSPWWSVIAVLALYIVWTLILSPDLVEYNRTSQSIKIVLWTSVLLALIDHLLAHGFAWFVIPIVCFSGLLICMALFFTNLETQKHNMLPLIIFIFISIVGSAIALYFHHAENDWPYMVLLALSILFLFTLIIVLGQDFRREMLRRFHIK